MSLLACFGQWCPAADAAPGQPGDKLLGGFPWDGTDRAEPVPGAHLGHAEQPDGEQVRLVIGEARIFLDHLADQVSAPTVGRIQPLAHRGLAGQVGLED